MLKFSYKEAISNKIPQTIEPISIVIKKEDQNQNQNQNQNVEDEKVKEVDPEVIPVKKKAIHIFVKKGSIPSKDDILRLCSHGLYMKINNIDNSHFTEENVKTYIHYMYQKINEIKGWRKEEKNKNESSQKRFKIRIDNIYKTMNLIKSKHLEYISNTIVQNEVKNENEVKKWVKISK